MNMIGNRIGDGFCEQWVHMIMKVCALNIIPSEDKQGP
jgi:hypothetical protein